MTTSRTTILSGVFFLLLSVPPRLLSTDLTNKIAFLRKGEIWAVSPDGRLPKRLTHTNGKINEFLFSAGAEYLAYSKMIRLLDGGWQCSIVVQRMSDLRVIKEIRTNDAYVYINKWLPGSKLLYYGSSTFEVTGHYLYDVPNNAEIRLNERDGITLEDAGFNIDGSLKAYIVEGRVGKRYLEILHLSYTKMNVDKVVASGSRILDPTISCDQKAIAFIDISDENHTSYDILWLYRLDTSSLIELFRCPAQGLNGDKRHVAWSLDDHYVALLFYAHAVLLEARSGKKVADIQGENMSWISGDKIAFDRSHDVYVYNVTTDSTSLLIKGANKSAFLW